ncbi:glutathione S-transferase [Luteibacter anthropi]|uniref:glutathione transferase n=1 Tax=Luteibacter anthropi TaxID=564369 RepID=A0A7X5UD73_9GAMM|nr:glutathione S-transferase [Luteibacter anthropi]NII08139.1 glutathione S-transferase [Luteibacter anthropi]URX64199.1 glutathione S-transferase [Luteibacter anthropi]
MIVVHHLNNSRSQRVLWLLEELGLPYEIVRYQRDPKTMLAPKEMRAIHPLGKSPIVVDGDVTVAESGAVVEYLVSRYGQGRLKPAEGTPDALRYTYFLHYAEGSAMPPLLLKLIFIRMESAPVPFFAKPVARMLARGAQKAFVDPQLTLHLDYLENEIGKTGWFAGDAFSAADIQMSFPLEAAASRGALGASRPNLMAFLDRIHDRPAYQAALERGGDYDLAPSRPR